MKTMQGMNAVYYAAMINAEAGAEIEQSIRTDLERDWNETLLVLYGCIRSDNPRRQLQSAEKWLKKHPQDAILLRMLGKLCIRNKNPDKAEQYLNASVDIEPSVDAYLFLGDMFSDHGQKDRASDYYRRGLMFASNEVVKQIDGMQVEPEDMVQGED